MNLSVVGYFIALVWGVGLVAGIATGDYEAFRDATPVMLVVAGFLFGDKVVFKKRNGE